MTIDLDKLKALVKRATPLPWQMSGSRSRHPIALGRDTSTHGIGPDGDAVAVVFHDDKTGRGFIDGKLIEAAVNSLPALIAKAERVDALERGLNEAAATFDQFAAALREHDAIGLAQEIAVADLSAIDARTALSPKPEDAAS